MSQPAALRLLIVDDHPAFSFGLCDALCNLPMIDYMEIADHGREALNLIRQMNFDIVFLDLELPVMSGMEVLEEILKLQLPNPPKIVIISHSADVSRIIQAYKMNIHGYILKNTTLAELNTALQLVADGEQYFSAEVSQKLLKHLSESISGNKPNNVQLSVQEKKVLIYICYQMSNNEIAEKLGLAEKTIKRHRYNIKAKVGARNTVGLVLYALRNGLIKTESFEENLT